MQSNNYLNERLQDLNINPSEIVFDCKVPHTDRVEKFSYFKLDENGNIKICYPSWGFSHMHFKKNGNKWGELVERIRLKNPIEDNGQIIKYLSPKGLGTPPFLTPTIIKSFDEDLEIDTLFFTEGEFKAFKCSQIGIPCIGLPSIHGFYGETKGSINGFIEDIIIKCKVKNIVYLTDADTLTVNWAKDKDLSFRPTSFYSAVKNFRNALEPLLDNRNVNLSTVYFLHINTSYCETAKGIDDLIVEVKNNDAIKNDILQLNFANQFFKGFNITDARLRGLYTYFGLSDEQSFFDIYSKFIGNREFVFKKRRYQFDGEKVVYVKHEDAERYMRIGADWFKYVPFLNKHGKLEQDISKWKIGEIMRDYKKFDGFIDSIPKYDGFCSVPGWGENYKRVHHNLLNMFAPLDHETKEGEFPQIKKLLKHLFRGQGNFDNNIEGDLLTIALDYLTIMYQYPQEQLPVPCLVSPEFGTGKSTFLKLLQAIYGSNMAVLNNEQFKMPFNSHYITKFIISIDEGFLDVEKKAEKERLKQLATADTQYLQIKGVDMMKFNYYGKLILCANDADKIMKMEEGEDRWWVVRVYPIDESEKDPNLEAKMFLEIPAFLHFLKNRTIFHKKETRFWFRKEFIVTEQMKKIVNATKSRLEQEVDTYLHDFFDTYENNEIEFTLDMLIENINRTAKYRISKIDLKYYLKEKKNLIPSMKTKRIRKIEDNELMAYTVVGKPYIFTRSEWYTEN